MSDAKAGEIVTVDCSFKERRLRILDRRKPAAVTPKTTHHISFDAVVLSENYSAARTAIDSIINAASTKAGIYTSLFHLSAAKCVIEDWMRKLGGVV